MPKTELTVVQKVRGILYGRWLAPWQVQDELVQLYNVIISEANVGARIRDNRKERHGKWNVMKRAVPRGDGSGVFYEYSIPKGKVNRESREAPRNEARNR